MEPSLGLFEGHTIITILGNNLGTERDSVSILVGGKDCLLDKYAIAQRYIFENIQNNN